MWTLAFLGSSHLSQVPPHIMVHLNWIWTSFLPSPPARNEVWWIYHWFGIYHFLISLLRNIILYAPGLWNYYNSHSEPALNKPLAKAISASEHDLAQNKTSLLRLQFTLKVVCGLQADGIPLLFWVDRAKESTECAPNENEHLPEAGCGSGRFPEQPVCFSREAALTGGQEFLSYGGWGGAQGVQAEALESGQATVRRSGPI